MCRQKDLNGILVLTRRVAADEADVYGPPVAVLQLDSSR